MSKLVGKWYYTAFDINFFSSYISNMASGGHFGFWFLTNSTAIFARVMGSNFFLNTSKSSNQVSNLTMLSLVTGPPDCTQLCSYVCICHLCHKHMYIISFHCHSNRTQKQSQDKLNRTSPIKDTSLTGTSSHVLQRE